MKKGRRSFPNERLKQERLQRGWTQADLAGFLGTDGYTVSRWERGRAFPSLHFQQILCSLFEKNAHDLGLVSARRDDSEAASSPSPVAVRYWSVPHPRNLCFTGRVGILRTLHRALLTSRSAALVQTQALYGLGGIGKTQIALEYAYQHAQEYRAVFWIEAETEEDIISSLLRIADVLQVAEQNEGDQRHIIAAVQRWLAVQGEWLLIWDNLEEWNLLRRFLPSTQRGAILITTRTQAVGTQAEGIALEPMEHDEAVLFVLRRAKLIQPEVTSEHLPDLARSMPTEYIAAEELVATMGGLPLALDQAGAYIEEAGCNLADYLQRYRQQRTHLLQRRGQQSKAHPHSVTTTFLLASERAEQEQAATADLLRVCALLHADAIPEELFLTGAPSLGPKLVALADDPLQFDQALAALRSLSLVQRQASTRTLSLHRLVQLVMQERMCAQERALWLERIIRALNAAFPEITHNTWKQCERLLPHVLTCAAAMPDDASDLDLAEVLRKAADYLRERARFEQAEPLYQRALCIEESVGGPEDLRVAAPLYGLALLYWDQGKYERAEPLCQRALFLRERALDPMHPDLARPLNGLAIIYFSQGKYQQAEPLYLRALHLREQALGREHPLVVTPLNNLAELYTEQGKYQQAECLYQRALHIQEQAVEGQRPQMAYLLHGLARLYSRQGKDEQAEVLYQRALHIREQELGAEHPYVAEPLSELAIISLNLGKEEQAEALAQRALHIAEQALGPEHLQIAHPLISLAELYTKQGKDEQAEVLYRRALCIQEQALGTNHPLVAPSLNGLATLYLRQRRDGEAERLYQKALAIQGQLPYQEHPDRARSIVGLARLLKAQGRYAQAAVLFQRALAIFEQNLGSVHPDTVNTQRDYAFCLTQVN